MIYMTAVLTLFICAKSYSSTGFSGEAGEKSLRVVYCLGEFFWAAGLMTYGFFGRWILKAGKGRLFLILPFAAGIFLLYQQNDIFLYGIGSVLTLYSLGILLGEGYHRCAMRLKDMEGRALLIALSLSIMTLIQYGIRSLMSSVVYGLLLVGVFVTILVINVWDVFSLEAEETVHGSGGAEGAPGQKDGTAGHLENMAGRKVDEAGHSENMAGRKVDGAGYSENMTSRNAGRDSSLDGTTVFLLCSITACLILFIGLLDGSITSMAWAAGEGGGQVFGWPRLFLIPGYVLAGVGAWKFPKNHGIFIVLCILPIVAMNNLFYFMTDALTVSMCLFYIGLGAVIGFYHIAFLSVAPDTENPRLWASFGRVIDSAGTIVDSLLAYAITAAVPMAMSTTGMWCLILLTAFLAWKKGKFPVVAGIPAEEAVPESGISAYGGVIPEKHMAEFASRYGLTAKEQAVAEQLIFTENIGEAMASELSISRRMLQTHIASIYEKTGTESRVGVVKKYYEM